MDEITQAHEEALRWDAAGKRGEYLYVQGHDEDEVEGWPEEDEDRAFNEWWDR